MKRLNFNNLGSHNPKEEYENRIAELRSTIESLKKDSETASDRENI